MENKYDSIDFSALVYGDTVSTEESLIDIVPFAFPEEVLSGNSQVVFSAVSQRETI